MTATSANDDTSGDEGRARKGRGRRREDRDDAAPYRAMDDASERDEDIESVAADDVAEEIRQPRKTRVRKYKIQEVIKVRQILLVQVVKEERGNKGAALTTYLSLAGRYCVLMPNTARGGGISRKITNVADRKKLKEIATSIEVPKGAGLIVRTAGAKRTKTEVKRDYEYLQRMWEQIRELTLRSIAPAPIYQEGDLIKRSIRDLYNRDIDEVLVEGEDGYRTAKDFMKMIMPSHAKNVKHYHDQMPLFARHQVESYLSSMFNPTVQLPSGGYIVIGVTEALVAIDVNSGRATREGSIEDTATKTNLEAAAEVARQLRLRDLAGLIVIDFIDMEDRRNNAAVEKLFKEHLKSDRARIQVGPISGFGLLEMSRQRLHPGMIEATTQPCAHCHGTGLVRSDDNLSLSILRQIEEEGVRDRTREVLVRVPVAIANYIMNMKREHVAQIEARYGMAVRIEADPSLVSPDFGIEKFKTQTARIVRQTAAISSNPALMEDPDDDIADEDADDNLPGAEAEAEPQEATAAPPPDRPSGRGDDAGDDQPRKRRRRRRRRKGGNGDGDQTGADDDTRPSAAGGSDGAAGDDEARMDDAVPFAAQSDEAAPTGDRPKRRRSRSRRSSAPDGAPVATGGSGSDAVAQSVTSEDSGPAAPVGASGQTDDADPGSVSDRAPHVSVEAQSAHSGGNGAADPAGHPSEDHAEAAAPAPSPAEEAADVLAPVAVLPHASTDDAAPAPDAPATAEEADDRPKRRGWWSLRR